MADDRRDSIGRKLLLARPLSCLTSPSREAISEQTLELATETGATRNPGTEAEAAPDGGSRASCGHNTGARPAAAGGVS